MQLKNLTYGFWLVLLEGAEVVAAHCSIHIDFFVHQIQPQKCSRGSRCRSFTSSLIPRLRLGGG